MSVEERDLIADLFSVEHVTFACACGGDISPFLKKANSIGASKVEIVNDNYKSIVKFFRVLRDKKLRKQFLLCLEGSAPRNKKVRRALEFYRMCETSMSGGLTGPLVIEMTKYMVHLPKSLSFIKEGVFKHIYFRLMTAQIDCLPVYHFFQNFLLPQSLIYVDAFDKDFIKENLRLDLLSVLADNKGTKLVVRAPYSVDGMQHISSFGKSKVQVNNAAFSGKVRKKLW